MVHCHVSKPAESYPLFKTNKTEICPSEAIDDPSVTTDGDLVACGLSVSHTKTLRPGLPNVIDPAGLTASLLLNYVLPQLPSLVGMKILHRWVYN